MQYKFTQLAANVLQYAREAAGDLRHSYIGTEHLLIGLLREKNGLACQILTDHEVSESRLMGMIDKTAGEGAAPTREPGDFTPRCLRVFDIAGRTANRYGSAAIGTEHLLYAILREGNCVASQMLSAIGVNVQRLAVEIVRQVSEDLRQADAAAQTGRSEKKKEGLTIDKYSRDLTEMARNGKLDPVVGRKREIQRVIQILSRRTKNNPCLIGEPGVGKTAIAEGLAQLIAADEVPETLRGKRLLTLDLSGMVAGSKYRGEFEERIKKIISEVSTEGDILLFIDELHTIIGAGGAEGALDAANILKPSLARGELQILGATTIDEYRKNIEKNAALERRFQPVMIEEPSEEETVEILKGLKPVYEEHHHVLIPDETVQAAVTLSARYISDRFLPDKAIDLVDEAASKVRLGSFAPSSEITAMNQMIRELEEEKEEAIRREAFEEAARIKARQDLLHGKIMLAQQKEHRKEEQKTVTEEDVADIVASWTGIPVQKLQEEESARLRKLEEILHQRVIGQEEAVSAISKAIRRGRVGLKDPRRPIGSFLFLGPTGVGKTELSKALAEAIFGREDAMIRVDMSEYMEKHSVSKLIGSPPGYVGYEEGGQLSEKIRRNPYSVILFDEIEKAHPDVFNILLQVLDDGRITDSQGRKVDFKNTVIIMTSNAGASSIVSRVRMGFSVGDPEAADYSDMKTKVMDAVKKIFKPEFLNRIDEIIVFRSLNQKDVSQIAGLMLAEVTGRIHDQLQITVKYKDQVQAFLAEKGFDASYGARPLRRLIQNEIEDRLAELYLEGAIANGDVLRLVVSGNALCVQKRNGKSYKTIKTLDDNQKK